ncbi:hypothetical protein IPL68_02095 [Candidatus Saccharibacteria bacterium]|nr:MAG: hypothetical protein IPL68_02095 [Candidatus Saccharibacteria bacterium]
MMKKKEVGKYESRKIDTGILWVSFGKITKVCVDKLSPEKTKHLGDKRSSHEEHSGIAEAYSFPFVRDYSHISM